MKMKIFIMCIIAIIIIVAYNVFLKKIFTDVSDDISISIDDLKIENIMDMSPSYDALFSKYNFPDNSKKDVEKDPDNYVVAPIDYSVTNHSEGTERHKILP